MTKSGYTHVLVPVTLRNKLNHLARVQNTSVWKLIDASINTGINTSGTRAPQEPAMKEAQTEPLLPSNAFFGKEDRGASGGIRTRDQQLTRLPLRPS